MKILVRYLTFEFLRNLFLISACFLSLFLIIDFFEKIRMFLSNNATFQQMVTYFLFRIPLIVSQFLPAAILLTALMTFGYLSRAQRDRGHEGQRYQSVQGVLAHPDHCRLDLYFDLFLE